MAEKMYTAQEVLEILQQIVGNKAKLPETKAQQNVKNACHKCGGERIQSNYYDGLWCPTCSDRRKQTNNAKYNGYQHE